MNIKLESNIKPCDVKVGDILYNTQTKDAYLVVVVQERYNLLHLNSNSIIASKNYAYIYDLLDSELGIDISININRNKNYELIKGCNIELIRTDKEQK